MANVITVGSKGVLLREDIKDRIISLEKQKKLIEEQEKAMKEQLLAAMEELDITKYETDELIITKVEKTYRETFDSKSLKADDEELYNKYIKFSEIKPSVRLTIK